MKSPAFNWQFITFFRLLFGLHLAYSAAAYVFFGWVPAAFHNPASPAGHFMVELDRIGLYPVVKYIELLLGILVLAGRFVPLAAVVEFPITAMIAYLNLVVEGPLEHRHYYTGVQELAINGIVLLGYGAYYRTMLEMRARPLWLWQPLGEREDEVETAPKLIAGIAPSMWLFFLAFIGLVMAASWFLGSADRRLPPRDWLPPVLAFAAMALAYRFSAAKCAR